MVTFKRENRRAVSAAVIPGLFMTLAAGVLFLTTSVHAQQPAKKAPAAAPAKKTTSSAWVKLCEEQKIKNKEQKAEKKRTVCLIHHERFHPTTGQPLISAAIRLISESKQQTVMIMVPLGRLLRPGLYLRVDKEK
ncbi:MAG: invasion associated locus B family protein, partial [Methyloligellaceae bacterium]